MRSTILALTAALVLAGCSGQVDPRATDDDRVVSTGAPEENDPMRTGSCEDAFQAVADADEPDATTELDMAINICNTLEDWDQAAEAVPEALGDRDPREVLRARCATEDLEPTPLCQQLASEG